MIDDDLPPESALATRLAPVRAWWEGLARRERRLLTLGACVLGGYLLFAFAIQPAWRTLSRAPAQLADLDLQLQSMQRMASEARELRAMPPVTLEQSTAALKAATQRLGDKAKLNLQGERAVLTLNGAGTGQLSGWLAEVRSGARARPMEANLTRGSAGYSGTIVIAIGGGT
jgi:general secretion pathway protein M